MCLPFQAHVERRYRCAVKTNFETPTAQRSRRSPAPIEREHLQRLGKLNRSGCLGGSGEPERFARRRQLRKPVVHQLPSSSSSSGR
jgi:hypothetical protein